jgi:outer membrane protein TolC
MADLPRFRTARRLLPRGVWAAAGLLGGCAAYQPQPLAPEAVAAALQPPPLASVKVAAAALRHPLLAPLVIDGRDGYTPEEIAVMVVVVSPELRALRDQRGVAEAQVVQAGILPNPQLAYALDNPHGQNTDPTLVTGKSLGLSWDVTALLTHHDQVAAARAQARSVDLAVAWQEWQAAQDARLRAFRILSLRRRLPFAREIEADLADSLSLTQQAVGLGYKTAPDLTAAADAWRQAENTRFDLETQLAADEAALRVALGLPPGAPLELKAPAALPALPAATDGPALLAGMEDRRLDLVALRYGYESADATLRAAIKAQFPKINLGLNRSNDTTPVYSRGGGVTVDLPIFDRNQGQVAIGRTTRQQLFDEYVARVAEARSQVGEILAELAVARTQWRDAEASLPGLQRLAQSLDAAMRTGNADIQSQRDARGALASRQMEAAQLQQAVLELGVGLEIATGRPLLDRAP